MRPPDDIVGLLDTGDVLVAVRVLVGTRARALAGGAGSDEARAKGREPLLVDGVLELPVAEHIVLQDVTGAADEDVVPERLPAGLLSIAGKLSSAVGGVAGEDLDNPPATTRYSMKAF